MGSLTLTKPLFIKDKSVVGVLLPNTDESVDALKEFTAKLKSEQDAIDEWDKELDTPEAHARYNAIVADCDANDGWVKAEDLFKELEQARQDES